MSTQGIIIIDIVGLALIALIINLVRTQKLYVGYAAIWLLSATGLLCIVSIPSLLDLVTAIVGAVFPVSALTLLAFVFMTIVLIFFSVKLTILSERQIELTQALALRELLGTEAALNDTPEMSDPKPRD